MGSFEAYASRPVTVEGKGFEVLSRTPEKLVTARAIVLHEVPGATPALERFANDLVAAGIEVTSRCCSAGVGRSALSA